VYGILSGLTKVRLRASLVSIWFSRKIRIGNTILKYRIFRRPSAGVGIVITAAESDQVRVSIMQSSGEAQWYLECWVGVVYDVAEGVVADRFYFILRL